MSAKKGSPLGLVILITPLIIAPFVLGGVYLGYYLGGIWGYSGTMLAILFSTIGFLASLYLVVRVVVLLVRRSVAASPPAS